MSALCYGDRWSRGGLETLRVDSRSAVRAGACACGRAILTCGVAFRAWLCALPEVLKRDAMARSLLLQGKRGDLWKSFGHDAREHSCHQKTSREEGASCHRLPANR